MDPSLGLNEGGADPFDLAIALLQSVPAFPSPLHKLRQLDRIFKAVQLAVEEIWERQTEGSAKKFMMATDDLLPILAYVVTRAQVPYLQAELAYISSFLSRTDALGKFGFYAINLQTTAAHLTRQEHAWQLGALQDKRAPDGKLSADDSADDSVDHLPALPVSQQGNPPPY